MSGSGLGLWSWCSVTQRYAYPMFAHFAKMPSPGTKTRKLGACCCERKRPAIPCIFPFRKMKLVLDAVPLPRNAPQDCPDYFWNGQTSRRAVVGIAERTLGTVFKKSGVKNARAHRFRHTLATRLLGDGATHNEVADILVTLRLSSASITASGLRDGRTISTA